jgi:Ca2+-binding EF-hand superfamily protein
MDFPSPVHSPPAGTTSPLSPGSPPFTGTDAFSRLRKPEAAASQSRGPEFGLRTRANLNVDLTGAISPAATAAAAAAAMKQSPAVQRLGGGRGVGARRKTERAKALEKAISLKNHKFVDKRPDVPRPQTLADLLRGVPEERRAEYKKAFNLFGPDAHGKIAAESIAHVLHTLGWAPSLASLEEIVAEVDFNGDGAIGVEEFMVMLHGPPRSPADLAAVVEAFQSVAFDDVRADAHAAAGESSTGRRTGSRTGRISDARLRCLLQNVGMRIQPAVVDNLLRDACALRRATAQGEGEGGGGGKGAGGTPAGVRAGAGGGGSSTAHADVGGLGSGVGLASGSSSSVGSDGECEWWDYAELVRLISDADRSQKRHRQSLAESSEAASRSGSGAGSIQRPHDRQNQHHHHHHPDRTPNPMMTQAERERRRREARDERVRKGRSPQQRRSPLQQQDGGSGLMTSAHHHPSVPLT